jgi:hypothetical protein
MLEPAREFGVGAAQRRFRIEAEMPGDIAQHEEDVAIFLGDGLGAAVGDLGFQLGDFLLQLLENRL